MRTACVVSELKIDYQWILEPLQSCFRAIENPTEPRNVHIYLKAERQTLDIVSMGYQLDNLLYRPHLIISLIYTAH